MYRKQWNNWSGKEDSNLRPLPPEDAAPTRTQHKTVNIAYLFVHLAHTYSRLVPVGGSA